VNIKTLPVYSGA